jgi:hypothetical protein
VPTGSSFAYGCLASLRIVAPHAEMQVHLAAPALDLVDLALAVLLTPSLERQHLRIPRELVEGGQHFSNGHIARVAGCVSSNKCSSMGVRSGAALFVLWDLHRALQ